MIIILCIRNAIIKNNSNPHFTKQNKKFIFMWLWFFWTFLSKVHLNYFLRTWQKYVFCLINFMLTMTKWQKMCFCLINFMTQGQKVEFHEIKIQLFQEVEFLIMRSKFNLFMRSNLSNNIDQWVKFLIMRSKPKIALFLISISWSIC